MLKDCFNLFGILDINLRLRLEKNIVSIGNRLKESLKRTAAKWHVPCYPSYLVEVRRSARSEVPCFKGPAWSRCYSRWAENGLSLQLGHPDDQEPFSPPWLIHLDKVGDAETAPCHKGLCYTDFKIACCLFQTCLSSWALFFTRDMSTWTWPSDSCEDLCCSDVHFIQNQSRVRREW